MMSRSSALALASKGAATLAIIALPACNSIDLERNRIMDQVEEQLRLPDNAGPKNSYAAYYGFYDEEVIAFFVQPEIFERDINSECEEMDGLTGELSSCFGPSNEGGPILKAGERYWLDDIKSNFPPIGLTDCSSLLVIYLPSTEKISHTECHSDQLLDG